MPDWGDVHDRIDWIGRWYTVGPYAILMGLLAANFFGAMALLPGTIVAMLPVWVYRSRGSRTPEAGAEQMAYEVQDSIQVVFGILTGVFLVMVLFAQTIFSSFGEMLAHLGNQAALSPMPIAFWASQLVSLAGISHEELSVRVVGGFALIAFAIAWAVKKG